MISTINMTGKADVALIIPQREEFQAIAEVFSVSPSAPTLSLPHGGTFIISEMATEYSSQPLHLAFACMDHMYNYPCLSLTERLLLYVEPKLIFLIGSACGNLRNVSVCDVVLSTTSVAYLGRGRRKGEIVNPRPYCESIPEEMKNELTKYMLSRTHEFDRWNRTCKGFLEQTCGASLPEEIKSKNVFEVKSGVIASDDLVLTWSDHQEARNFWAKHVLEEAKAYDMESAGFSHACSRRINNPNWAVIRGISDHGIDGTDKYHLAAATIAASWLQGFITKGAVKLLGGESKDRFADAQLPINEHHLKRICLYLELEQKNNLFVGKRRFIRKILKSDSNSILALEYAIMNNIIKEYEISNPKKAGHYTTAIKLDK
jgi:nucleoside phosphorylase